MKKGTIHLYTYYSWNCPYCSFSSGSLQYKGDVEQVREEHLKMHTKQEISDANKSLKGNYSK
jgi:hypothetical protein